MATDPMKILTNYEDMRATPELISVEFNRDGFWVRGQYECGGKHFLAVRDFPDLYDYNNGSLYIYELTEGFGGRMILDSPNEPFKMIPQRERGIQRTIYNIRISHYDDNAIWDRYD